jgi:hypothetical protein
MKHIIKPNLINIQIKLQAIIKVVNTHKFH